MRRPICLIGLAFVAALMAGTALLVRGAQTFESLEKEKVRPQACGMERT